MWGDRFERELKIKTSSDDAFIEIKERLLKDELVYNLRGENNLPYLSLTDKGIAIVNRLYEIERILEGEDIDAD
jgi:predicted transcriptional regulator